MGFAQGVEPDYPDPLSPTSSCESAATHRDGHRLSTGEWIAALYVVPPVHCTLARAPLWREQHTPQEVSKPRRYDRENRRKRAGTECGDRIERDVIASDNLWAKRHGADAEVRVSDIPLRTHDAANRRGVPLRLGRVCRAFGRVHATCCVHATDFSLDYPILVSYSIATLYVLGWRRAGGTEMKPLLSGRMGGAS
jgi:hypothetical protein